ncbi:MAG TPA: hypothetical protein EYP90_06125 [Chromatiaceae bacterium]|nr:hypothetical protein [Chromatiaceae bacterium]
MPSFHQSPMNSPSLSRAQLRRQRRALSGDERHNAAFAAAGVAASHSSFRYAKRIAFYLAVDGELDPMPLIRRALLMGKCCYLPVLHPLGHQRLWFARWRPGDHLRPNRYGIAEPLWNRNTLVDSRADRKR